MLSITIVFVFNASDSCREAQSIHVDLKGGFSCVNVMKLQNESVYIERKYEIVCGRA